MYHSIESRVDMDPDGYFTVPKKSFERQMQWLKHESEFSTNSIHDEIEENSIAVSFDDGYASNIKYALPILEEYKIPCVIFVATGFIKQQSTQFISRKQLHELANHELISIGSHTVTHPHLVRCNNEILRRELVESKLFLEDICGKQISCLSYPNGSYDTRTITEAKKTGYQQAYCSRVGYNATEENRYSLARTCIYGSDKLTDFKGRVFGHNDWHGLFFS